MNKTFAVLGSGMQGTAAAYDLAKFADPAAVILADANLEQAARSASRVNQLLGTNLCRPFQLNVLDPAALADFLQPVDVLLSCVPYWMHPKIAKVAIGTGTGMCDLGGNTDITLETLALDECAKAAGVTLIPDTGLAPGFVNSIGLFLIEQFDTPESVNLFCGVLPQNPIPPFNYKLTFNVEGLLTEYMYEAVALRHGEIVRLDTLAEVEPIEVDGFGTMEAFNTSGGTSTAPYTFQGKLQNYQYKTIRWPGHCERMRVFRDIGLWGEDPVDVKGQCVRPKDLFCKVFGESLAKIKDLDQCLIRGVGTGTPFAGFFIEASDLTAASSDIIATALGVASARAEALAALAARIFAICAGPRPAICTSLIIRSPRPQLVTANVLYASRRSQL